MRPKRRPTPSRSTPRQTECWDDCKAAYRLIENEEVSFAAITAPHYQANGARSEGTWLSIAETTAAGPLERAGLLPRTRQTRRLPWPQVGRRTGLDDTLAWI